MAKNPYTILGVKKTATDKEIQKAYRALAKKLHPDVNPGDKKSAERFKEISAAYTLLSDKNLRAQYDSGQVDASGQQQNPFAGGFQGTRGAGGQEFHDMGDLFSSLFGMQMGAAGPGAQRTGHPFTRTRNRAQKGADIRYQLEINLPEAVRGVVKHIKLANGKSLKITIPEGTKDDDVLRLRGKGESGQFGGPNGDAKITIKTKSHKYLKRDGNNLRLDLPITLKEAVLGAKIHVPTPNGKVSVNIAKGSSSGKILRLKGKGEKGGDLLVRLMIQLPDKISDELRDCVDADPNMQAKNPRDKIIL
ncbi:MAG: J domain-containing protein [Acidimicrobiales bacterium]|nr:MAG: J domain-containing protein [Acidimicrobiales bacterium]